MTPNSSADEAEYWNTQGIEYLKGTNKQYSPADAERCFAKAISLGCTKAEYNLHILYTLESKETKQIIEVPATAQTELYGYDKLSREERMNVMRRDRAGDLRERISILKNADADWKYLSNDDLLYSAFKNKTISIDEYNELDRLRICSNKILHRNASKEIYNEFDKNTIRWEKILEKIEERLK